MDSDSSSITADSGLVEMLQVCPSPMTPPPSLLHGALQMRLTQGVVDSFKGLGISTNRHVLFMHDLRGLMSHRDPNMGSFCLRGRGRLVLPSRQSLEMQLDQVEETTAHARSTLNGSRRRHGDRCAPT